jgi:urease accessory protein
MSRLFASCWIGSAFRIIRRPRYSARAGSPAERSARMTSDPVTNITVERHELKTLRRVQTQIAPPTSGGPAVSPQDATRWLLGLLQAGDSLYPTGSYAHSFGLEGLVQEGVVHNRESLEMFLRCAVLPALQQTELPIAAHAWRAWARPDWGTIGELCVLSSALKTSREARAASESIGRQRAELVANLRGSPLAREFLRRADQAGWPCASPVSAALEGHTAGAPLAGVLAGVYYTSVASLLSAAMKILRLGQNAAQSLLTGTLAAAPAILAAAEAIPIEEIGWFNPWLDIAAARHEAADARMFIS